MILFSIDGQCLRILPELGSSSSTHSLLFIMQSKATARLTVILHKIQKVTHDDVFMKDPF